MNIVAIDTATDLFSVALAVTGESRTDTWVFRADSGMRHSELLPGLLDVLVRKAGIMPKDIGGVVCMGGPGSFTGLRIGYSLAKALALSCGIPFAAVPTLDCLARPLSCLPGILVPVLDAKKRAFFCAPYRGTERLGPFMDATPAEIAGVLGDFGPEPVLLFGPGAEMLHRELLLLPGEALAGRERPVLGRGLKAGDAGTLLEIALETGILDSGGDDPLSGPGYLRKSDAELSGEAGCPH
ncbi:MAG: tRNA (adenosine(37)-N6)-threonylcarbamoyltransferase complex dimerization subunit type 1 TsaB [Treponema sp.]|nr:tRNA (adenosine(37)-N6)-threonylcarbamoyltransferase complex dimerization subunit type 1 TsaB [Treponema sp.]